MDTFSGNLVLLVGFPGNKLKTNILQQCILKGQRFVCYMYTGKNVDKAVSSLTQEFGEQRTFVCCMPFIICNIVKTYVTNGAKQFTTSLIISGNSCRC